MKAWRKTSVFCSAIRRFVRTANLSPQASAARNSGKYRQTISALNIWRQSEGKSLSPYQDNKKLQNLWPWAFCRYSHNLIKVPSMFSNRAFQFAVDKELAAAIYIRLSRPKPPFMRAEISHGQLIKKSRGLERRH